MEQQKSIIKNEHCHQKERAHPQHVVHLKKLRYASWQCKCSLFTETDNLCGFNYPSSFLGRSLDGILRRFKGQGRINNAKGAKFPPILICFTVK